MERESGRLVLWASNRNADKGFEGKAVVSFDAVSDALQSINLTLTAGESRQIPLPGSAFLSGQYVLKLLDKSGRVISFKIARIPEPQADAKKVVMPVDQTSGIKVKARLVRGEKRRYMELPSEESDPFRLHLEVESAQSMGEAELRVLGSFLLFRKTIDQDRRAAVEFDLPENLPERKLRYEMDRLDGTKLARGEIDLNEVMEIDAVKIAGITMDRNLYAPGQSIRLTVELQSEPNKTYKMSLTLKDGGGNLFYQDERTGAVAAGKTTQEFLISLPEQARGSILLAYQVFAGATGIQVDSGVRQIALQAESAATHGSGTRLSP